MSPPEPAQDGEPSEAVSARSESLGEDRRASRGGTPPASASSGVIAPGTVIGERYRIDELLGEGGMGKVYRAEHVHMRKLVAVKVLHDDFATTEEVVKRFEREAVAAGNISHPNVASATDFGRLEDGSFFLVLELVQGRDLRSLVNEGPLAQERAVRIVRQIAAAAAAAHAAGVIHRDLKPENIMLVDGRAEPDFVKVLDFGIAKIDSVGMVDPEGKVQAPSTGPQPITKIGAIFGTPDYMSPEQALGQPIDARADLYSIGIILYELLSGERPFRGGAVSMMRKHVLQDAPPLPPAVGELRDPRLQEIVTKLLQKSPVDRYAGASELEAALAALAERDAPPPSRVVVASSGRQSVDGALPTVAAPGLRQKKSTAGLWFVLVVFVGAGGYAWVRQRSGHPLTTGDLPRGFSDLVGSSDTPSTTQAEPGLPLAPSASAAPAASAISVEPVPSAEPPRPAASEEPGVPAPSASVSPPESPSAEPEEPEEVEEPTNVAAAPQHAGRTTAPRHGPSHPPAHSGHHKPQKPPPRHTGPGGIYIPPPNQWFK
jgi:serine/threonine-protein kinase